MSIKYTSCIPNLKIKLDLAIVIKYIFILNITTAPELEKLLII